MANDLWDQTALYKQRFGGRCQACAHAEVGQHEKWCPLEQLRQRKLQCTPFYVGVDLGDECDKCVVTVWQTKSN